MRQIRQLDYYVTTYIWFFFHRLHECFPFVDVKNLVLPTKGVINYTFQYRKSIVAQRASHWT